MTSFSQLSREEKAQLWACLALRHAEGIGLRRARLLADHYGSPLAAVETGRARPRDWTESGILPERPARAFAAEKWRERAAREWHEMQNSPCSLLLWTAPEYPALLREIPDAPLLLYCKGDKTLLHNPAVGIVGARNCTREGMALSALFARGLSEAGVTVVSGMAKGIDRVAHLAGLKGPGRSIAVLGTGINLVYPPDNTDIAAHMEEHGLIISEFSPDAPAVAGHFPVRNRIISGLSRGVLVVEAAARSGSLITARLALEQNRDIFAVPGHATSSLSGGCRRLIRQGAKPVFHADDILQELAPLLHEDARNALERRRHAQDTDAPRDPADRHKVLGVPEGTLDVLVEGMLPWEAPAVQPQSPPTGRRPPARTKKKTGTTVPEVPPPCGQEAPSPQNSPVTLSPEEETLVAALGPSPLHIDALSRNLSMDVALVSRLLLVLELRGLVRRHPGMSYSLPSLG